MTTLAVKPLRPKHPITKLNLRPLNLLEHFKNQEELAKKIAEDERKNADK